MTIIAKIEGSFVLAGNDTDAIGRILFLTGHDIRDAEFYESSILDDEAIRSRIMSAFDDEVDLLRRFKENVDLVESDIPRTLVVRRDYEREYKQTCYEHNRVVSLLDGKEYSEFCRDYSFDRRTSSTSECIVVRRSESYAIKEVVRGEDPEKIGRYIALHGKYDDIDDVVFFVEREVPIGKTTDIMFSYGDERKSFESLKITRRADELAHIRRRIDQICPIVRF